MRLTSSHDVILFTYCVFTSESEINCYCFSPYLLSVCFQTVFHFDVQQKGLEETLDRFAQFFTAPLLNADSVEREINAVDNGK